MKFFHIFCLCISPILLSAQSLVKLYGKVTDSKSNQAVEQVNVYIPESKYYAISDDKGEYQIFVPRRKNLLIKVSRLGYTTQSLIIDIPDKLSELEVNITVEAIVSDDVVVESKKNNDHLIREQGKDFVQLPSTSQNIESILPSIALGLRASSGGELSSQYSVRGGSYDENLLYVNDFEIYRPQLIRNGQQEGLSFANLNLIRELNFSSGGFEAKYGDKQSSVLDIRYKQPHEKKYSAELSLLGASVHAEGNKLFSDSKNKELKYLVGVRYKSNQYLLNSQSVEGEYSPHFADVQTMLSYSFNRDWQISFLGNLNLSRFSLIPQTSAQARGSLLSGIFSLNTIYEGREVDFFNTAMTGISLLYFPKKSNNHFFIKYQGSAQGSIEAEQFDLLGYYRLVELELSSSDEDGKEIKLWGEGTQHRYGRNYLQTLINTHEVKSGIELGANKTIHHLIQTGIGIKYEKFNDRLNEWERIDSAGYSLPYSSGDRVVLNEVTKSKNEFSNLKTYVWIQDAMRFSVSDQLAMQIVPGIRMHYNKLNDEFFINPRARLEIIPKVSKSNFLAWIATGTYYQAPFYRELRNPDGSIDFKLMSQKSFHFVIGVRNDFEWRKLSSNRFHWISEIYYKKGWDQVSYDLENVRIRYSGSNDSKSYAIGWDTRINGEFVPGAESWINFSILRTRESINNIQHLGTKNPDGTYVKLNDVPRPTDQLYSLSLFFQDYLPNNENFKTHVQTTISSGIPYGVEGDNIVRRNQYRFKTYHRVDIGFSYKLWDYGKRERSQFHWMRFCKNSWISLEVFNLMQVKNPASVRWIKSVYNYEFAIPYYLSSRRINLRFRIEF
ncbi:MAG: carboxypeptidase-like regulatory domain-containing protein [Saprospiraceae bacterium]|nr:carboxypeptidase-like regulatory domain-containing protein [Saprospiraceae bacterium]